MIRFICFCLVVGSIGKAQTQAGAIMGSVRDERFRPVHGAVVELHAIADAKTRPRLFQTTGLTGRNGAFRLNVPSGTFQLCVQLAGSDLLPTCVWERNPNRITVAGNTVQAGTITLRRGYPVIVQIHDVNQLVAQERAKRSPRAVFVRVDTPGGIFLPLPARSGLGKIIEYRTLAPRDVPVTVRVQSRGFDLKDERGTSVAAQSEYKVILPMSGEKNRQPIILSVADLRSIENTK